MKYEESYRKLEDIIRRAEDNQGTVIVSENDIIAIREAQFAIYRISGFIIQNKKED